MDIRGRVALVTGGGSDLGQRICRKFAEQDIQIAITYHASKDKAHAFIQEVTPLGVDAAAYRCDVGNAEDVDNLMKDVLECFGRLDILINCAAITDSERPTTDINALTPELWEQTLRTNTTGAFLCIRAAAPALKASGAGRVVNIASSAGFSTGGPLAYAVSKAGLIHLTRCLAAILAPEITVNCIAPGMIEETVATTGRIPPDRLDQVRSLFALKHGAYPDDIAEQLLTFIRSNSTTGQTIVMDGGRVYP